METDDIAGVRTQPTLDDRIANSKLYEEESLKRLALLDQRLKRLEKLDERLAQLKSTHVSPPRIPPQIQNPEPNFSMLPGSLTSDENFKSAQIRAQDHHGEMHPHAALGLSPVSGNDGIRRNSEEVLRQLVQEEIESMLLHGKNAGRPSAPISKYTGMFAATATELPLRAYTPHSEVSDSSNKSQIVMDGRRSSEGKRGKVAWGVSAIAFDEVPKIDEASGQDSEFMFTDKNDLSSMPRDINPASKGHSLQDVTKVMSRESTFRSIKEPAMDKYAMVESRRACISQQEELMSVKVVEIKEPRSLEEASAHTMPYFFGGFTRQSPVRAKCFQMNRSAKWKACFIIINLANCLYITLVPEVNRATFNSEISTNAQLTRRTATPAAGQTIYRWGGNGSRRNSSPSTAATAPTAATSSASVGAAEFFEFFCVGAILAELLIGSIAVGFISSPTAYLRCSYFHKLDFVILLMSGLEYFLIYSQGIHYFSFRAFRLLRLLQPLLRMKLFRDVKQILETLSQGAAQLLTITAVLILFLLAFSVCGMSMYQRSFRRRCVSISHLVPVCSLEPPVSSWDIAPNCTFLTGQVEAGFHGMSEFDSGGPDTASRRNEEAGAQGEVLYGYTVIPGGEPIVSAGYPFEELCKIYRNSTPNEYDGRYPLDATRGVYHNCELKNFLQGEHVEFTCMEVENPWHGFQHFDHIGGTLLSLGQYSVVDGAYDVLHNALESEPDAFALTWIFFPLITFTNTFLVLGLFLAVIANTFQEVRRNKERSLKRHEPSDDDEISRFDATVQAIAERRLQTPESDDEDEGGALLAGWAKSMLQDDRLRHFLTFAILLHVTAMSADANESPTVIDPVVHGMYVAATVIFASELLLRFTAEGGSKNFFGSAFNLLETTLVLFGVVGLVTQIQLFSLLPSIRLFRLCQYWPTLQDLLMDTIDTIGAFLNLLFFVGLVCICFAVAGRYIFRNEMDGITRSNFGTLSQALLTIFQIFTGDQWSVVLYDAMSSKFDTAQQFYAAVYILVWLLLSHVIFSDLFVAVLIENFEIAETVRLIAEPGRISTFRNYVKMSYKRYRDIVANAAALPEKGPVSIKTALQDVEGDNKSVPVTKESFYVTAVVIHNSVYHRQFLDAVTAPPPKQDTVSSAASEDLDNDNSLFFFATTHPFRLFCIKLSNNAVFQTIIYFAIFISCIILMATPPAEDVPKLGSGPFPLAGRKLADKLLTCVFTVECIVSVVSKGFLLSKTAYLRSAWNVVDFVILCLSLLDLSGLLKGSLAKIGRLGRALRPLRLVKRNKGLRDMMEALFATLPPIGYVIGLWMFVFMVFAIVGMGAFGGKMYLCSYGAEYPLGKPDCSGVEIDASRGILMPRAWYKPTYHFDSLAQATLTLFRITTVKYVDILRSAMDITNSNMSPSPGFSSQNSIFFVCYLIVGAFFVMNVFIAFIVDGFNMNRGSSPVDLSYNKLLRQIESHTPRQNWFQVPKNSISKVFRRMAETRRFKGFSLACVGINVIFMLADHADPDPAFVTLMNTQNLLFFLELVFEVAVNLIGFGPGGFIDDTWKLFDFLVMFGSAFSYVSASASLAKAAKAFRLFRVIRLMRMIKAVRSILETMISSLPQFGNILLLLFLAYSMFATFFVQEFGLTKFGARLGPTAQFINFQNAMITCYQMVTEDEWMTIMDDVSVQWPECTPKFDASYIYGYIGPAYSFGDCGNSYARLYFVAFKLICESILLNLFIGVILEKFGFITDEISAKEDRAWSTGPSGTQFIDYVHHFERHAAGTPMISIHAATSTLLFQLNVPLGFRAYEGDMEFEETERVATKYIRAELNVILRRKYLTLQKARHRWKVLYPVLSVLEKLVPGPPKRFINGVDFSDLTKVLVYWRKPSLTPDLVKAGRKELIEEVVVMSCALTIFEFFRRLVARKRQRETAALLSGALLLNRWMRSDSQYVRRAEHYRAVNAELAETARARRTTVQRLEWPASARATLFMETYSDSRDSETTLLKHQDAVASQKFKILRPKHGLDALRRAASSGYAVVRFVDTVHRDLGTWRIDMRTWGWDGWNTFPTDSDAFLRPSRVSPTREPASWTELLLRMPPIANAQPSTESIGHPASSQMEEGWTVLDVQSFLEESEEAEPASAVRNVVRLHLAKSASMDNTEQRETQTAAAVEVIGYLLISQATE